MGHLRAASKAKACGSGLKPEPADTGKALLPRGFISIFGLFSVLLPCSLDRVTAALAQCTKEEYIRLQWLGLQPLRSR